MSGIVTRADSHGVDIELHLDRDDLLPNTAAQGSVTIVPRQTLQVRGIVAALVATEQWRYRETYADGQGHTQTRSVTKTEELLRLPVVLSGPVDMPSGMPQVHAFEVPVPPLGPASLEAEVSRLSWALEVKIDVGGGFDPSITVPVHVLQPTALLRAGVVHVGEFALYEAAESEAGEARATVQIEPMPICLGQAIDGTLTIETNGPVRVQEVRLELRVKVQATVHGGEQEELTVWVGRLAADGQFGGPSQSLPFRADIPPVWLPTIELPHGSAQAEFHVILAKARARDTHLVRDVAICTTTEV